jgi:type II secretory pathway pseudopilin PulG
MKNVVAILVIGLAVTLGTPNMATAQDQARQMTAQVMRVNRDAQALIVRAITPDGREVDSVFSVQEAAASALADLRPGEMVRITYVQVNGQLRAQRIVKVPDVSSP